MEKEGAQIWTNTKTNEPFENNLFNSMKRKKKTGRQYCGMWDLVATSNRPEIYQTILLPKSGVALHQKYRLKKDSDPTKKDKASTNGAGDRTIQLTSGTPGPELTQPFLKKIIPSPKQVTTRGGRASPPTTSSVP